MRSAARQSTDPSKAILLAPVIFAAHVAEEAPGFVAWFNSLVAQDISERLFVQVNLAGFAITLLVTAAAATARSRAAILTALGWLSFVMFANAILHLVATAAHQRYSPGVVTAAALYLPYFGWFLWLARRRFGVSAAQAAAIVALAGLPMYVHGYLIVFEGRRFY
jgi:hypothetical protein